MDRYAAPMKFYRRDDKSSKYTYVKPLAELLPRETFEGHPDVLKEYDTMVTLNAAIRSHAAEAARKTAEADAAAKKYQSDVTAALAEGKDPAKIKNAEPQLRAEAVAHEKFSREARANAERQGYVLGGAMRDVAPACFATSEQTMKNAADDVSTLVAALESAWQTWATAWDVRRRLGHLHVSGGLQVGFRPGRVPAEVGNALEALRSMLGDLDTLKAEEAEVARWRKESEDAQWSASA